jgi:NADH:quinone reductase (non-electrogenic)
MSLPGGRKRTSDPCDDWIGKLQVRGGLGEFSTIDSLMGLVAGKGLLIEGYVARVMYCSLYRRHEAALHGPVKVGLDTIARAMTRPSEPHVKLH